MSDFGEGIFAKDIKGRRLKLDFLLGKMVYQIQNNEFVGEKIFIDLYSRLFKSFAKCNLSGPFYKNFFVYNQSQFGYVILEKHIVYNVQRLHKIINSRINLLLDISHNNNHYNESLKHIGENIVLYMNFLRLLSHLETNILQFNEKNLFKRDLSIKDNIEFDPHNKLCKLDDLISKLKENKKFDISNIKSYLWEIKHLYNNSKKDLKSLQSNVCSQLHKKAYDKTFIGITYKRWNDFGEYGIRIIWAFMLGIGSFYIASVILAGFPAIVSGAIVASIMVFSPVNPFGGRILTAINNFIGESYNYFMNYDLYKVRAVYDLLKEHKVNYCELYESLSHMIDNLVNKIVNNKDNIGKSIKDQLLEKVQEKEGDICPART